MLQKNGQKMRQYNEQYQIKAYRTTYKEVGMSHIVNSKLANTPKYSFGRSNRDEQQKRYYSNDMLRTYNFGKQTTMGKIYKPKDHFCYTRSPSWKINTKPKRNTEAQYQYYQQQKDQINVRDSDAYRRPKSAQVRFGTEQRFREQPQSAPGPQYYPQVQAKVKQPQYSIGVRRVVKGQDPFNPIQSSNQNIGPGVYHTEKSPSTGKHKNSPKWSIPKNQKMQKMKSSTLHQTYDAGSSMGVQKLSNKSSQPKISINKTNRSSKTLIMSAHMQYRPMQVRIAHPNF